jgi:hypothetical protein
MDDDGFQSIHNYFPGEGEIVRAVQAKDWSATPIGPLAARPACLRSAVSNCLNSDFQAMVLLGPGLVCIYNDASISIVSEQAPVCAGPARRRRLAGSVAHARPGAELGPVVGEIAAAGRLAVGAEPQRPRRKMLFHDFLQPDPDRCRRSGRRATMETTRRVLNERRQRTLNRLATQVAPRRGDEQTLDLVRQAVAANLHEPADSLLLRVRDDGVGIARQLARTVRSLGITGMRERAALAKGRLMVGPLKQCGTLVSALIPMNGSTLAEIPAACARQGNTRGATA